MRDRRKLPRDRRVPRELPQWTYEEIILARFAGRMVLGCLKFISALVLGVLTVTSPSWTKAIIARFTGHG